MRARPVVAALALLVYPACQSSPPPQAAPPAPPDSRVEALDAARAWAHLEEFAEIGPRVMGTQGAARAREYILAELEKLGLETTLQRVRVTFSRGSEGSVEELELYNIAAVVPGASSDVFLVIAPFDTRPFETFSFPGVNDGGSGAALLLELARVLAADPLPYTTWLVFLEGEAPRLPGRAPAPPSNFGSYALAQRLKSLGALQQVRLAVVLNQICDADLHVARDLGSHRIYREEFWRAAARLGYRDAFPPAASFESPAGSHQALIQAGLRPVVALIDTSFGGSEPPGPYAGTEDDDLEHCSSESLRVVGEVTLEALGSIGTRLAKIDRFSESPVTGTEALRLESLPATQLPATGTTTDDSGAAPPLAEPEAPAPPATDAAPEAGAAPEAAGELPQVGGAASEPAESAREKP